MTTPLTAEIQSLSPSALIDLFEIDLTPAGGNLLRFHAGTNGLGANVVWQGNTYEALPIEASGFDKSSRGTLPRPKIRLADVDGIFSALANSSDDFIGCKVTRKRTLARYLDAANFPSAMRPSGISLTFTRNSVGTYFDAAGVMRTAAADVPRFDYNPATGVALGILIEEARTNLFLRSAELSNASYWLRARCTVSPDVALAPDGTMSADMLVEDVSASLTHYIYYNNVAIAANTNYAASIFLKAGTRQYATLELTDGATDSNSILVGVNLAAGTITSTWTRGLGTAVKASIKNVGNGWYRVELVGKIDTTSTTADFIVYSNATLSNGTITGHAGDGSSGLYVWGGQLEAGSFATSYIPTTTATVARQDDMLTLTFLGWANFLEGTFLVSATAQETTNDNVARVIFGTGNTTLGFGATDSIYFTRHQSSAGLDVVVLDGNGVSQTAGLNGTAVAGSPIVAAIAYKTNDFAVSYGGAAVQTDTVGTVPTNINAMSIGSSAGCWTGGRNNLCGHVKSLKYWNARLPNADLQTLAGGGSISTVGSMSIDFTLGSLQINTFGPYNPDADPNQHFEDEAWFVERKVTEIPGEVIEWELASAFDLHGVSLPFRTVIKNTCTWKYKGSECGYGGTNYFDANDTPTTLANDVCGKRLSSCKARFGSTAVLPFGGFPGSIRYGT